MESFSRAKNKKDILRPKKLLYFLVIKILVLIIICDRKNSILSEYIIYYKDDIRLVCYFNRGGNRKSRKIVNNMQDKLEALNKYRQ